jgi:hsdS, type I site-specific deoxyribonuclease
MKSFADIPAGWTVTSLGRLVERISGGGTPSKSDPENFSGNIPFMTVKDMKGRFVSDTVDHISEKALNSSATTLVPADTLVVATRMSLGKIVRPLMDVAINQDLKALFLKDGIDKTYIEHFWRYSAPAIQKMGTGTTVKGIRLEDVRSLPVPVPPSGEQRRIADKLDRVLARVDAANEHLSRVGPLLKRFRQVVLDSAVSGVLTADWRAKHGCQSGWPDVSLGGVLTDIRYGTSKKCFSEKKGVPVLRIPNVGEGGEVVVDELKYAEFDESELASFVLRRSDLLLIRSNGSPGLVGRSCLVGDAGAGFVFAGYLIRLRPNLDVVDPDFLNYVLRGTAVRRVVEGKVRSTSGVNNINTKELKSLRFLLPSIDEQQEIVRRVRLLMTSFDEIDQMSHSVARSVDLLSPSVLALAFSGGLVEQNPLDEPASELLARLAEAKASENHKPTRRKRQASA